MPNALKAKIAKIQLSKRYLSDQKPYGSDSLDGKRTIRDKRIRILAKQPPHNPFQR